MNIAIVLQQYNYDVSRDINLHQYIKVNKSLTFSQSTKCVQKLLNYLTKIFQKQILKLIF